MASLRVRGRVCGRSIGVYSSSASEQREWSFGDQDGVAHGERRGVERVVWMCVPLCAYAVEEAVGYEDRVNNVVKFRRAVKCTINGDGIVVVRIQDM